MTEEKESRIKYLGQIIVLFALEILILLFRIAVPVGSTIQGLGETYKWFIGEIIYMCVQGFLIVILVNHLIFKNSYREIGLTKFKENSSTLIGNLFYLGIVAGVTYGINYISGGAHTYSISYRVTHVIISFISIAFLHEVIYRGCLLNAFLKLTKGNAWLSIISVTLLFVVIHVPYTMAKSNFESLFLGNTSEMILISAGIGLYLGLLYYWTNNIWICVIIHGTYNAIDIVGSELLLPAFKGFYIFCLLIYLVYVAVCYMRSSQGKEDEEVEHEVNPDIESKDVYQLNEAYESYISQKKGKNKAQEINKGSIKVVNSVAQGELEYQMIQGIDELSDITIGDNQEDGEHSVDSKNHMEDLNKADDIHLEDLNKTVNIYLEDLNKTVNMNLEDLNKTVNMNLEDLNKTTNINLEDLSKTAIINLNELEKANHQRLKQVTSEGVSSELKETKFEEKPSYMNHLERSLGEFENIYKQVIPTDPPIDILSFQGERFNALVTNGMRYVPMNVPDYLKGNAYAELVMFVDKSFDLSDEGILKEENNWLLQSIRDLAMYPRLNNSYLCWGHIVGNGEERIPYYEGTSLCGMLVYPPVVQDDMKFYTFKEGEKTTYIYNVMPLYTEEIDFILKHSGDAYFARIKELGISQIITKNRPNVCIE